MDFLLIFSEKPKTPTKDFAIQLAKECEFFLDKGRYKVIFHEINSKLIKILPICSKWPTTQLFIDNKEFSPKLASDIFNCLDKSDCNGICRWLFRYGIYDYFYLSHFLKNIIENASFHYYSSEEINNFFADSKFIKKIDENTILVNKETLKNNIFEDSELPLKICQLTNRERINKLIDSIPEKIELKNKPEGKIISKIETIDSKEDFRLTEYQKERYQEIAEFIAPICAREIKKELIRILEEQPKKTENEKQ